MKPYRHWKYDSRWTIILTVMWALLISMSVLQSAISDRKQQKKSDLWAERDAAPVTDWFVVHNIHVNDVVEGACPTLNVDRSIIRRVRGTWVVSLVKLSDIDGKFYIFKSSTGTQEYQPAASLPDPLYLSWWMAWSEEACKALPVGRYKLYNAWEFYPLSFPAKGVSKDSNVFSIYKRS